MKRLLPLLIAVLLLCPLAGCAAGKQNTELPPAQAGMTPVPDELPALPPEPPIQDWIGDVPCPDFLNAEQQDLYLRARTAFHFLTVSTGIVETFPLADGSRLEKDGRIPHETVTLDGVEYNRSMGRFRRWDDFQTMLDGLFTPELQEQLLQPELLPPLFVSDENGGMCYYDWQRSDGPSCSPADIPDRFELVSQDNGHISFTLITHCADLPVSREDREEMTPVSTELFPIRMVLTEKGWRFEEFHLPY